jgi:hypothetical protein
MRALITHVARAGFQKSGFRIKTRIMILIAAAALLTGAAYSQVAGRISGSITDPTGAVVSGATIVLRNTSIGRVGDPGADRRVVPMPR